MNCGIKWLRHLTTWLLLLCPLLLAACAGTPKSQAWVYLPDTPAATHPQHLPALLVDAPEEPHNRIGTPAAKERSDREPLIIVDPGQASLYFEVQQFSTAKSTYTNLVYRLHFPEVPFLWTSPHLTAGPNPGFLLIFTLDASSTLLLITTVHTCGCYLAFIPTSALPVAALPEGWSTARQSVYGQTLPGLLPLPADDTAPLLFAFESQTHRLRDVAFFPKALLEEQHFVKKMAVRPMLDLYSLPYQGKTVSFFESEGPRRGYVKNNSKILEWLLMSWWAFDSRIGEDKAFSVHDDSEVPFYTSLKPWAREASDLKNFPAFLSYWGWRL